MAQASDYQRTSDANGSVTYAKNHEGEKQALRRVILTVPLLHIKAKSRKYEGKEVTRGYYVNIPKATIESMDLKEREQVEIMIKKLR